MASPGPLIATSAQSPTPTAAGYDRPADTTPPGKRSHRFYAACAAGRLKTCWWCQWM
jgi:hypothetical protein